MNKEANQNSFIDSLARVLGWIVIWAILVGLAVVLLGSGLWIISIIHWAHFVQLDARLVLQYIQSLIWPVIVIVLLTVFHRDISALISRMKSVNTPAGSAEFDALQKLPEEGVRTEIEDINKRVEAPTLNASEEDVYNDPEVRLIFERIYRDIFGTQFQALNFLAANPVPLSASLLSHLYDKHRTLLVSDTKPYPNVQAWMQYLVNFGLVEYNEGADTYQVLSAGLLFLRYMASQGLAADNKSL